MRYAHLSYTKKDHIARITLNRPDVQNTINQQLARELEGACGVVNQDEEVYVVVISGAGDQAFCSGSELPPSECHVAAAVAGIAANAVPGAALAGGLVKELSWSISDSVDTHADIRQLSMIPSKLFVIPIKINSISSDRQLELLNESGRVLARGLFAKPSNQGDLFVTVARF